MAANFPLSNDFKILSTNNLINLDRSSLDGYRNNHNQQYSLFSSINPENNNNKKRNKKKSKQGHQISNRHHRQIPYQIILPQNKIIKFLYQKERRQKQNHCYKCASDVLKWSQHLTEECSKDQTIETKAKGASTKHQFLSWMVSQKHACAAYC